MGKNIIIGLLVVVSLGCIIFAFYQKTLSEQAIVEAEMQRELVIKAKEEALKQQNIAEMALLEAERQRQIALSKCN